MEDSDDDMEEDGTEWSSSFVDSATPSVADAAPGPTLCQPPGPSSAYRVILHFDLDCFYAQVEMIRNPALRHVPLGIQQKYIIVTCNYVAREQGLTKLMSVTDAKEKCPQLVLVSGEDLTHYRDMSYKVTELLMSYCPLVERLGFDENFMDVTEMVEKRLIQMQDPNKVSFAGHVYNHIGADIKANLHPRLVVGSHIAAELREAIHSKLSLTGCAGIATNKLLAKLVSGTFKPNQQTTLLPENHGDIMGGLSGLRKVPGVGHQTAKKLQALGLVSVQDLRSFPLNDLVREFGASGARRLKDLSMGIDDSPVTPTGAPQSLSDEDSFKKMSSKKEVLEKIQQLLCSLVERMNKDGRQPQTFRLTIRKYSVTNKWFGRESRQCPIPNHVGQKISSGSCDVAVVQLVPLAMKLFHKMVDTNAAFHLTLINVCFSNLQTRGATVSGKGSITSFFTHGSSPRKTQTCPSLSQRDSSQSADSHSMDLQFSEYDMVTQHTSVRTATAKSLCASQAALHASDWTQSSVVGMKEPPLQTGSDPDVAVTHPLPSGFDPEVFKVLPEVIQKELLTPAYVDSYPTTSSSVPDVPLIPENTSAQTLTGNTEEVINILDPSCGVNTVNHSVPSQVKKEGGLSSDSTVPGDVDPQVFSELPPDVQRELMSEWKQQKPALKMASSRKPGRSSVTKERKAAGKGGQANSLLKYFKPG